MIIVMAFLPCSQVPTCSSGACIWVCCARSSCSVTASDSCELLMGASLPLLVAASTSPAERRIKEHYLFTSAASGRWVPLAGFRTTRVQYSSSM